ncbi:23S rRNA (adenine(2030)-N(6))-methyltransferase RlmJ [Oleiagrimonas sp. C23AA]|uniref:23S rRNA (adenine(2030)-N(6))-methyltransferase RlmJ n=1 Tax=Oleiagrimonas sp. C23AA TaxID=2719047 RepID=UPI001422B75A|nr:23S rRNA (adenine(2030)-N(6))-methyltransferase RlmJ [Oleiagrimonas sp. C23AA]NII09087.1 23S rRNA (adenine(2030)-N(6))-methyltransferase RlmJ [Oleiagrimonas sp. C23AA]
MNYRHAFHAGNFADVLKHAVLVGLIDALKAKSKPFCYVDTHAGAGRYDLKSQEARKTGESEAGIARLQGATDLPPLLRRYLEEVNPVLEAGFYPGSPLLAARLLREDDGAELCEVQDAEFAQLRALFADDAHIHVHQRDGYAAMKALLPPKQKRGLVLIDPPFEAQEEEFRVIRAALDTALARWPNATYAVWYPIKQGRVVQPFRRWLAQCPAKNVLDVELLLYPDDTPLRLNGTGIAILNPPWRFDTVLHNALPTLGRLLGVDGTAARYKLNWLRQEGDA